jgi:NAD+ diphosphatase
VGEGAASGHTDGINEANEVNEANELLNDLLLSRASIDRAAHLRTDDAFQAAARDDARSMVMWVHSGAVALQSESTALLLTPARHFSAEVDLSFLGLSPQGAAMYAVHHHQDRDQLQLPDGGTWAGLREVGHALNDHDAGLAVNAVALDNWRRSTRICPGCGDRLVPHQAGWSMRCAAESRDHFPRTEPAVIMLVRDPQDRALLGRQVSWQPRWFSTFAGFVEAGESAEAAVRRELFEEVGVRVQRMKYLGSQPWPFPASLMLGYHAWTSQVDVQVDQEEIAEARWFTRDELKQACVAEEILLPPAVSISRKLIERWFGDELPGRWLR